MRKKRAHGLGKAGLSWEHICLPAVVRDSIQGRELTLESIRMMAPVENRSSGLVVQEMRIALAEQEARMASLGLTVPTIENELID